MTPAQHVALLHKRASESADRVVNRNQTVVGLRDLVTNLQIEITCNAATLKSDHVARHLDAALVHVTARARGARGTVVFSKREIAMTTFTRTDQPIADQEQQQRRWPVQGPQRLGDMPETREAVVNGLKLAQAGGFIPTDRDPPDDDDLVLWIGSPGDPAAFAIFHEVQRNRVWLDILYTRRPWRRIGFAKRIVAELVDLCSRRGVRRIMFGTTFSNGAMRDLGVEAGFKEESLVAGRDLLP